MPLLTKEELNRGFRIGDWEVFPARGELHCGGQVEKPEPKVLGVLISLAMRDGDVVTKDELVDEVWGGRATADDPIIRCVFQLRGHLNDRKKPYQYIGTLVRRGYCLQQSVVLLEPDEKAPVPVVVNVRRPTRIWALAAVMAIIVTGVLAWWKITSWTEPLVASIGVLPFDNLTGDSNNDYIVSGFKEELVHTLRNIPDFAVKSAFGDYKNTEIDDVARQLRVESVLQGALRKNGGELRFDYKVARAQDGVVVSSGQVSGPPENLFDLQEELARMVWESLKPRPRKELLSSSRPANSEAYTHYIRGLFALDRRGVVGNLEEAIMELEASIELDPNYGPAYLALAEIYVLLPDYRGADLSTSHDKAIEIVEQGIAKDSAIEDAAGAVFGFVYHKQKHWADAERAFIRATSATVVESNTFNWYSLMLGSVGRFDAALEQALAGLEVDPSSTISNGRVAIVYTWTGQNDKAGEYFERSRRQGGEGATLLLANGLYLTRLGRFEEARVLVNRGIRMRGGSPDWIDPFFAALADSTKREAALAVATEASAKGQINPQIEVTLRMMLGDTDGAMAVARKLVQPGEIFEMDLLFLPEFLPLRERPEFLELMTTLGVTDYWKEVGCVWRDLSVHCSD